MIRAQNSDGWSELKACPAFMLTCPDCPVIREENSVMPAYGSALTSASALQSEWSTFHASHAAFSTIDNDLAQAEVEALDNVIDQLEDLVSTINAIIAEATALKDDAVTYAEEL